MPADNASLLDTRVLSIAFTVSIAYSGFMTMAYFLIWYMIQQADRLREASKREHYEAMQTLQLQHMNERINEARQIKHNIRHHIQTLQALAAAALFGASTPLAKDLLGGTDPVPALEAAAAQAVRRRTFAIPCS